MLQKKKYIWNNKKITNHVHSVFCSSFIIFYTHTHSLKKKKKKIMAASSSSSSSESDQNNLLRIPNPDEWPLCCISLEPIDRNSVELPCRCSGSLLRKECFDDYVKGNGFRSIKVVTTTSDPPTGTDENGNNATKTVVMDRVGSCPTCRANFRVSEVKPLNKSFLAMLDDSAGVCPKCMKLLGKVTTNSGSEAIKHECDLDRIREIENKIKKMEEDKERARRDEEEKRRQKQEKKRKESEAEERIFFDQNGNNNKNNNNDRDNGDKNNEEDGCVSSSSSSSPKSTREKFLGGKAANNNNNNNGGAAAVAWSSSSSTFTASEFLSTSSSSNQQQQQGDNDDDDDYESQSPFQRKVGAISQGAKDWVLYFQNVAVNGISKISGKK